VYRNVDEEGESESDAEDTIGEDIRWKCCSTCWVVDEFFHHKKKGTNLEFTAGTSSLPLPRWAIDMMLAGRWNTAMVLGIYFTPQQGGSENKKCPDVGDEISIKGSYGMDSEHVKYLGYLGKKFSSCGFWQGSDESGRATVYVNLNALTPAGITGLRKATFTTSSNDLWNNLQFSVLNFTQDCLRDLWLAHGVRDCFFGANGLVSQLPGAQFIFNGYSHGGPMAQGVALLFCIERERRRAAGEYRHVASPEAFVINWNGYRWLQEDGKRVLTQFLGDHHVDLVSLKRYKGLAHYDPTSGFPESGVNSANLYSIDIDSSRIEKLERAPDLSHRLAAKLGLEWIAMHSIHIKAIKRLTAVYSDER
jgi:hypothetical protein